MAHYSLRDFLSPIWRYALSDKYKNNPNIQFNRLFLRALDNQLKSVEVKTAASKADLYLNTARGEYLDYYGSWFGLERLDKHESDDHYRNRIRHHIEHPRSTIPALREALSSYLHTSMDNVHIYEPWQDIFITDDYASRTDGRARLYGYEHRPAVIDIIVTVPFKKDLIDYINWFRPAGVIFMLTYDNSANEGVIKMPALKPLWQKDEIDMFIGFSRDTMYNFNLLDFNSEYGHNPFYVSGQDDKLSLLNGGDVLLDANTYGHRYYSYLGVLHGLLKTNDNDYLNDLILHTVPINPDLYPRMNEKNGLSITVTHHFHMANMLSHSGDLHGNWQLSKHAYLANVSDKGRNVVRLIKKGASLTDDEGQFQGIVPNPNGNFIVKIMHQGQRYYIGIDVKTTNENGMVGLTARVNQNQTIKLDTYAYVNKWTHIEKPFVYDGSRLAPIKFTLTTPNENLGDVELSSPMLSDKSSKWMPSKKDLNKPDLNNNSQYIYGFLNIWQFYFTHVESAETVYNKLLQSGDSVTPQLVSQYIADHFNRRYLNLAYEPRTNDNINTRLWLKDYYYGKWINYDTHLAVPGNQVDNYHAKLDNMANLIDNHGMMTIALQVPAFDNNYQIRLYDLYLHFDYHQDERAGIQMYKPGNNITEWMDIDLWHLFDTNAGDTHYNNLPGIDRNKSQHYYPIRYIRNWIRYVSYYHRVTHGFITNDSVLNGTDLLNNFQTSSSVGRLPKPYFDDSVVPSLDNYGNPVKSVSILGVTTGDQYPTNRLNNLLKKSVYGYFSNRLWNHTQRNHWDHTKSRVYMLRDVNSQHVWFNNKNSRLWTDTESIGSRNCYIFSFNANCVGNTPRKFKVEIQLHSNRYVKKLSKVITIQPYRQDYTFAFDTYGVFPDYVRFEWTYLGLPDSQTPTKVPAFDKQPSDAYMPDEPAYIYDGTNDNKVPVPSGSKDIKPGWNFNGTIPYDYSPAWIPSPKHPDDLSWNNMIAGYIPNSLANDNQLSYVDDGHGDYAMGYNMAQGYGDDYTTGYFEDKKTGKFVPVIGPVMFNTHVTPFVDTADVEFRNVACRLNVAVSADGRQINEIAPQVNYEGQDTMYFNDVQFGQPLNEFNFGETFADLEHYGTTFEDFKRHNTDFNYLLGNVLRDGDSVRDMLKKDDMTYEDAEKHGMIWEPATYADNLAQYYKDEPESKLTFEDLKTIERFNDLKHYNNTFLGFEKAGITFEDLLHHIYGADNKALNSNPYTFKYAYDHDWRYEDGEPYDHREHCVTLDLGRIYTNIDHILVHHGSGSLKNAVYESCIQTSADGKHWKTWYDNYKGLKPKLDKKYVEPRQAPIEIPIASYDCQNSKQDRGKVLNNRDYVSDELRHWPTLNLGGMLFDNNMPINRYHATSYDQSEHIISPFIPSLDQALKAKSKQFDTGQSNYVMNDQYVGSSQLFSNVQRDNRPKNVIISSKLSRTPNNWSDDLKKHNPVNVAKKIYKPLEPVNGSLTGTGWHIVDDTSAFILNNPYSLLNGSHVLDGEPYYVKPTPPKSHKPETVKSKNKVIGPKDYFVLNNPYTVLNSPKALLGDFVPGRLIHHNVSHKGNPYAGTISNPNATNYTYDMSLIHFNVSDMIKKAYPNDYNKIKSIGINDPEKFVHDLLSNESILNFTLYGNSSERWSLSVWNFKTNSWQNTIWNALSGSSEMVLKKYNDCMDKDGNLYILALAVDPTGNQVLKLKDINLELAINMKHVNSYFGGMYPHINYDFNASRLYHVHPNGDDQKLQLPAVSQKLLGHKMTVSFNLMSSTFRGAFCLNFGELHTDKIPIEDGHQDFCFTFDLPDNLKPADLVPTFTFYHNDAQIYVFGFKAELGIKATPFTQYRG